MPHLALIGAGNMAEAIANGVISSGVLTADQIIAADPSAARLSLFAGLGIETIPANCDAAQNADVVMLCTKPQKMPDVLMELRSILREQQLIITIAAGISTAFIEKGLDASRAWRVVRVMPNTPMLYGQGATAICAGRAATNDDLQLTRRLFESASTVVDVDESVMDTVTAVSGSGPAYFFYLVEHMIEAATQLGLSPLQAQQLVYQTAAGAAKMLMESTDSPAELRKKVTSPGGTTHAALEVFAAGNVGATIQKAIAAAQRHGRELGR
jgi:pyrroline-5-carboxylate reductase